MENTSNSLQQLCARIKSNAGTADLNQFVFDIVRPTRSDRVLELGCGSGKQLVPMSALVQSVTGIDVSADLLALISEKKPANATLVKGDMDAFDTLDVGSNFTLVYSCYALYYSKDVRALMPRIARSLAGDGARFFSVAPDTGNNARWFDDLQKLFELPAEILASAEVSRRDILPAILENFSAVHCYKFANDVSYQNIDDLMDYYDGFAACRQSHRAEAQRHFANLIARDGKYVIQKRALGILST